MILPQDLEDTAWNANITCTMIGSFSCHSRLKIAFKLSLFLKTVELEGILEGFESIPLLTGKHERCDWFFLGRDFAIRTISMETVVSRAFFCFRKPAN